MDAPITVVGGTGYIGRRLVERLVGRGASVRIVSRQARKKGDLAPTIEHVTGDIEDAVTAGRAVEGASAVVYLVGTTSARSEREFYALHRDAPARLAAAARRAGARRFLYVSAMGVAPDAPSMADRSKAAGEAAVSEAFPGANAIRPALVYGPGDHFFTLFSQLVRSAPAIPLIGGGRTRFQPMHVEDAAEAMARVLEDARTAGCAFELGGSEIYSFRELIERMCAAIGRRPWLVPVPFLLAEAGALATQWLPNAPLTVDQVRLLKTDKVIRDPGGAPVVLGVRARGLEDFLAGLSR
ncbi:MAG: NAD-dependent epimerase/dehydratase family protein [Betaproteobacteria bacterium]|nr:NAD-dependent epimerase/dehydratase family protein [Betaproteobacteria bacterium]